MALPASILLFFTYSLINLNALAVLVIIALVVGGVIEIISVKQSKKDKFYIWEYNSKTTLDWKILGVAVEDMILFLILTPIFAITAWEAVKRVSIVNETSVATILISGTLLTVVIYAITYTITKPK